MLLSDHERGLSHLKDKWMSSSALQQALINAGVNVFVNEHTEKFVSSRGKVSVAVQTEDQRRISSRFQCLKLQFCYVLLFSRPFAGPAHRARHLRTDGPHLLRLRLLVEQVEFKKQRRASGRSGILPAAAFQTSNALQRDNRVPFPRSLPPSLRRASTAAPTPCPRTRGISTCWPPRRS